MSDKSEVLQNIQNLAKIEAQQKRSDYWTSDEGQSELLRMIDERSKPPGKGSLSALDYTQESKAMLSAASPANQEEEWYELEMTADTGACDTVMPKEMASHIPIQPSLQSLRSMQYEVADGTQIPNLGERRCVMWTEDATSARKINVQVADVHKPLLSLSRCADMGFESRFGRRAGALIDEESGEVNLCTGRKNLYMLRCWVRAAPFGRQKR